MPRLQAVQVANYFKGTFQELRTFGRITGHADIHELSIRDLCTISREIAEYTDIPHA